MARSATTSLMSEIRPNPEAARENLNISIMKAELYTLENHLKQIEANLEDHLKRIEAKLDVALRK